MCDEDLEAAHHLSQGDRAIALPILDGLGIVDEDDEVLVFTLVVDLRLGCVTARHGAVQKWLVVEYSKRHWESAQSPISRMQGGLRSDMSISHLGL